MLIKTLFAALITSASSALKFPSNIDGNLIKSNANHSQPLNFIDSDLTFLTELPLGKLLKIKKSVDEFRQTMDDDDGNEMKESRSNDVKTFIAPDGLKSSSLPLIDHQQFTRKTGYGAMTENPWDSKPSKIQTFFQISITALAFLAFAGYLLCMIVQAIKSKGTTTYMYPNSAGYLNAAGSNTMNSAVNSGSVPLRKRRPIGRRRRNILLSADNRNDTITTVYEEGLATPDPSQMYQVMISMAEGYVKLHHFE